MFVYLLVQIKTNDMESKEKNVLLDLRRESLRAALNTRNDMKPMVDTDGADEVIKYAKKYYNYLMSDVSLME